MRIPRSRPKRCRCRARRSWPTRWRWRMWMRSMRCATARATAIGNALRRRAASDLRAPDRRRSVSHRRRVDRPARAAQCVPRVSCGGRRCRRHRAGQGAVRCGPEHDRRAGGAGRAVGDRLSGAPRRAGCVPCALARRRPGAGQVVRDPGDVAAAGHPERRARAGEACGLRPAQSEPRARSGGELRVGQPGAVPRADPAAATAFWPTPSSRSIR